MAFTNIFYLGVIKGKTSFYNPFSDVLAILLFSSLVVSAVEAEILFRFIIQRNLTLSHKIVRILITSAAFTICHFFFMLYRFNGIIIPLDLIELLFIFGIGFLLGFLYEYTNNIFVPMTFSMIFYICKRLINEVSFSTAPGIFYLTLSLVTLGTAAYLLIFYFVILKRENR